MAIDEAYAVPELDAMTPKIGFLEVAESQRRRDIGTGIIRALASGSHTATPTVLILVTPCSYSLHDTSHQRLLDPDARDREPKGS